MNPKSVDDTVGYQDGGVDADGLAGRRLVAGIEGCCCRDQAREAEGDACCDSYLAEEVEPGYI